MGSVVGSRRFPVPGRQQSWVRFGERAGYHRGLRAGHGFRGGTRELGRATWLLVTDPEWGTGWPKALAWAGRFDQAPSPAGRPRTREARKVSGNERQAKNPEKDRWQS